MPALPAAVRGVEGYEYYYRVLVDDGIAKFRKPKYLAGRRTYLFEIRTSFIMRTSGSQDQVMDSEKFHSELCGNLEVCLMADVMYRLGEYWMTRDEIRRFVHEAFDFAVQTGKNPEHASRWLTCVAVDLEVCTVQRVGEPIDSVKNRVVREAKLVPLAILPIAVGRTKFNRDVLCYLFMLMTGELSNTGGFPPGKIRVENVEEGSEIMPVCKICSMGPMLGTYISVLPLCNHIFHSHCIARRMLIGKKYLCPTCKVRAFPY